MSPTHTFRNGFTGRDPSINTSGQVIFTSIILRNGVVAPTNSDDVIHGGPANNPQLIAWEANQAPGFATGVTYSNLSVAGPPQLDNSGRYMFNARVSNNDDAIYTGTLGSGSPQLLMKQGDSAPGTASATHGDLIGAVTFRNGRAMFIQDLGNASASDNNAVYRGGAGSLQLLAREGATVPSIPGASFGLFYTLGLASDGSATFFSQLVGAGISTEVNGRALWHADASGALTLLARIGVPFDIGGGVFRTPSGINTSATPVNSLNQTAFSLTFTDSTSGTFLATVPEPTMGVVTVALATLCLRRTRRRISN